MNDIRTALRGLRRAPTFAITAVLILGFGIGMATAMLTIFRAELVQRLPVTDPERLVVLRSLNRGATKVDPAGSVVTNMARSGRTVRGVAGVYHFPNVPLPMRDGDRQVVMTACAVTANFFDVLGVRPYMGRMLRPEDGQEGAPHVMVVSYSSWRRQFGGDPNVVGRRLVEPGIEWTFTIVGVAPPGLDYPAHVDHWQAETPGLAKAQQLVVARLAPGATAGAAATEYLSFVKQLETQGFGVGTFTGANAEPLSAHIVAGVRPVLWALTCAVALLLLIACVNVGNLLLLRGSARSRELAIRRALGASRWRVVRHLLVESAILAAAGGTLGVAIAAALLEGLIVAAPKQLPRLDNIHLDGWTLAIALAVTTGAVLVFGLVPSLTSARTDLAMPLRAEGRSGTSTKARHATRRALVVSQVALALMLVAGAGLLARSLTRLETVALGYDTDHLSFFATTYPAARYDTSTKELALADRIEKRLRDVSGVTAATPVIDGPFGGADFYIAKLATDYQTDAEGNSNPFVPWEVGGRDFFKTLGIPIVEGRGFLDSDDERAELVVVISQSLAKQLFPNKSPIGEHLRPAAPGVGPQKPRWTIVGVAGDTHYRELKQSTPIVYHPYKQIAWQGLFAVRTSEPLGAVLPQIKRAIAEIDPGVTLWNAKTADSMMDQPLAQPRLSALLLSGFGLAALLLAAIGLYGVMASAVRERTREFGVRMALGATPENLRGNVLRQALSMAGVGVAIGVLGALAGTRLLRALLYEVSPSDPVVLGGVCGLLVIVAAIAAYVPARRATQIDPARALRAD